MSSDRASAKQVFEMGIRGAKIALQLAKESLDEAIDKYGSKQPIDYPETAYELPAIYAWDGREINDLSDIGPLLEDNISRIRDDPTVENALIAGEATMIAAEVIEALKYINNMYPYENTSYCGFIPDKLLRELGVALVDDTIPGVAVLVGEAADTSKLIDIVRDLQSKGILIIASYNIIEQLREADIKMGLDRMLYPVGTGTQIVHALNFAIRGALSYGGVQRGDREALKDYLDKRPKTFVLQFGPLDDIMAGAGLAAILNGAPVLTDQNVEEIPDTLLSVSPENMVQTAIEIRGIRVKLAPVDIPVSYGPAFEGEVIRRPDTYVEAGGAARTPTFELLRLRNEDEVIDGHISLIGKDVDEMEDGTSTSLAIIIDVYGRKMEEDFESVLERRVHQFINFAEGAWHTGQRNLNWVRLSRSSVKAGLTFKHFGDILITKLKEEFGGLVSRIQVTIITDEDEVLKRLPDAMEIYGKRDARLAGLTDESVDVYYTCSLCASFAPDHICVITPERMGLCGALNWLDARASKEIAPAGPNQPIIKGKCLDPIKGQWEGVNESVYEASHHKIERMNVYSIMEDPMTSCGCFEVIVAMAPDMQSVVIVNREYLGMIPLGMKFSSLAGSVGGGKQTPGFIGAGRKYITSKKFISADGGFLRISWMPKELKESMRDVLEARAKELGEPDFVDKIADETITTDAEGLMEWLAKVNHPAIHMPPLLS